MHMKNSLPIYVAIPVFSDSDYYIYDLVVIVSVLWGDDSGMDMRKQLSRNIVIFP